MDHANVWSPHERKEEIERVGEEGERQETSSRLYHGNKASIGRINWIHSRPGVYTSLTVHSTLYASARFSISGGTASPSFFLYRHSGAEHSERIYRSIQRKREETNESDFAATAAAAATTIEVFVSPGGRKIPRALFQG